MKPANKLVIVFFLSLCHFVSHAQQPGTVSDTSLKAKTTDTAFIKFDDTRNMGWAKEFDLVEIRSNKDSAVQKAYFYKAKAGKPGPLIVSLHTWSGNYSQRDDLAALCRQKGVNYIHPDFRGENKTASACCSELALADIDDAIGYAIQNGNVDTAKIYVIGVSGGGYATLATFMKSKHHISKFSAWASITDLEAWYHESTIVKNKYAADIFACTDSKAAFNIKNARDKSPMYMRTPMAKLKQTKLFIYCGIYDGIQGSVPITHSINFYNKLLADLSVKDKSKYVSDKEKLSLLEFRSPLGNFGNIADRAICLQKKYGNICLTIFTGNHEMLSEYALNEILKD